MRRSGEGRCTAALLCALCLLLCACGGAEPAETPADSPVTVWYIEGCPFSAWLEALAEEYNVAADREGPPVELRAFPDEEGVAAAFELMRPDLFLCAQLRAVSLDDRGLLKDTALESPPDYGALREKVRCAGRSFFPVGLQVQLLFAAGDAFPDGAPEDMEALLRRAAEYGEKNRSPFFTADSFAGLMRGLCLDQKTDFVADREKDLPQEGYVRAYNLLAEAAYAGGLTASDTPAAVLVRGGELPCAAVRSTDLAGLEGEDFLVAPLPGLDGGESCPAECFGLAVTGLDEGDAADVTAFLNWLLQPERLRTAALGAGLAPPMACEAEPDGPLEAALLEIAGGQELCLCQPESEYVENRAAWEADFRQALRVLY